MHYHQSSPLPLAMLMSILLHPHVLWYLTIPIQKSSSKVIPNHVWLSTNNSSIGPILCDKTKIDPLLDPLDLLLVSEVHVYPHNLYTLINMPILPFPLTASGIWGLFLTLFNRQLSSSFYYELLYLPFVYNLGLVYSCMTVNFL